MKDNKAVCINREHILKKFGKVSENRKNLDLTVRLNRSLVSGVSRGRHQSGILHSKDEEDWYEHWINTHEVFETVLGNVLLIINYYWYFIFIYFGRNYNHHIHTFLHLVFHTQYFILSIFYVIKIWNVLFWMIYIAF